MNYKTLSLALILGISMVFTGCQDKQEKTSKNTSEKEVIENHELVKTENMTIVENADEDVEWDMISRSSVKVKGYKLEDALKLIAHESPAYVKVKGIKTNPRMLITYTPADMWEASEEESRQIVLDSLQKFYDFKIYQEDCEMKVYRFNGYNADKLSPREGEALGRSGKTVNNIRTYNNYSFDELMNELERDLGSIFINDIENTNKFDFSEINISSADKAIADFADKYGMNFTESTEPVNMTIVEFK
jgi:hypothetical protein